MPDASDRPLELQRRAELLAGKVSKLNTWRGMVDGFMSWIHRNEDYQQISNGQISRHSTGMTIIRRDIEKLRPREDQKTTVEQQLVEASEDTCVDDLLVGHTGDTMVVQFSCVHALAFHKNFNASIKLQGNKNCKTHRE